MLKFREMFSAVTYSIETTNGPCVLVTSTTVRLFLDLTSCLGVKVQCPLAKCSWQRILRKDDSKVKERTNDHEDNQDDPELGIVGGVKSDIKDMPYIVSIWKDGKSICGGVILNNTSVG